MSEVPMKMSAIGRAALERREGVRLSSYKDSKGIWTIGVGHTAACGAPIPGAGVKITMAECDAAFARDLAKFEAAISAALKVPVADHEFDALVSLAFNVGEHGAAGSTVIRRLNVGDRDGAAQAFLMWNKPVEILDRRKGEMDQFVTPYSVLMPKARRSDPARIARPATPIPPPPDIAPPAAHQPAKSGGLFSALGAGLRALHAALSRKA